MIKCDYVLGLRLVALDSGELFKYALRHVTVEDIERFCPSDPGYPAIRAFTEILASGVPP
jgi:hypothetical protein